MAIYDLFSKRQRRQRGEMPNVYQYDDVPKALRGQLVHIFRDGLGRLDLPSSRTRECLEFIHDTLCREYGVFTLSHKAQISGRPLPEKDVYLFLLEERSTERVIDAVELTLRVIEEYCGDEEFRYLSEPRMTPNEVIEEVNTRFREHGVGFQYESGKMVRVDSQIIHQEAVRPALHLLQDPQFKGANEEYLRAHEHYRHGRLGECLNDCLKSLESTLKSICDKRKWTYKTGDTAKALLKIVFDKGLVPGYLQSHFSTLRQNLESGVPTLRNKLGGHGQGTQQVVIPQHLAAYELHMTASAIVFLVESDKAMP